MKWPLRKAKDLCILAVDCVNKTAPTVEYETPYMMIRTTNVKSGFVYLDAVRYVTEETFNEWTRRSRPVSGDVVLTREAPLGEVGRFTSSDENVFLGQRLFHYRPNPALLDWNYLAYVLQSREIQGKIRGMGFGATVEHIKVGDAENLEIPCPPIAVQRKIGDTLSAYDDLIENNRRRIQLLEESARLLYKEWFVHLRFPGHEHVKVTAGVPQGWERRPLSDIAEVNRDSLRGRHEGEILYIDIASVTPHSINEATAYRFADAPGRARRIVQHGDILWSCVRPNRRSHAVVWKPAPHTIASTGFAVITPRTLPTSYLYQAVTTNEFVGYLTSNARGVAYPAVTAPDFEKAMIVVPPTTLAREFDEYCAPLIDQAQLLAQQNAKLTRARDLLLPRLMSGELAA